MKSILKDFLGKTCSHCGGRKDANRSFCNRCYRALPEQMQKDLWEANGPGILRRIHRGAEVAAGRHQHAVTVPWWCEVIAGPRMIEGQTLLCFECAVHETDARLAARPKPHDNFLATLFAVVGEMCEAHPGFHFNKPNQPSCQECEMRAAGLIQGLMAGGR